MNLRKLTLAILAAMSMLLGGLVVSAPAEAVTGSTPFFASRASTVASTWRLKVTTTSGVPVTLNVNQSTPNGFRGCPSNLTGKIRYTTPAGTTRTLPYGDCVTFTTRGTWRIKAVG